MILQRGEKIFVITRCRFESDIRRHFVGIVESCEEQCIRASGYVFILDSKNQFVRRPERRNRMFSLVDGIHIINIIPQTTQIEKVQYRFEDGYMKITDGEHFKLNIDEFKML